MQIQGTGEIGSTKRKFQLSGVPLTESRLYIIIERLKYLEKKSEPYSMFNKTKRDCCIGFW